MAGGAVAPSVATNLDATDAALTSTEGTSTDGTSTAMGQDFSTTNDQEVGVDEPDMAKTDGQVMVILRRQPIGVQVVDVATSPPVLEGFLALPQLDQAEGLFLTGQYVIVIGDQVRPLPVPRFVSGQGQVQNPRVTKTTAAQSPGVVGPGGPMIAAVPSTVPVMGYVPVTEVVVVSVADPDNPSVVRTFDFQGQEQGARLIDGQVALVLTNQPRMRWVYPVVATAGALRAATAANRAIIERSTAGDWLPSATVETGHGRSGTTIVQTADCASTYHTAIDTGLGTVSVVSLGPLSSAPGQETTVVGDAEDVYASATDVFVATTEWRFWTNPVCPPLPTGRVACPMEPQDLPVTGPGTGTTTDIYGFDISNPAGPVYLGAGSVPGSLIGQYAMSEYNGYLRVATTVGEPTPAPIDGGTAPAERSDNVVSVLSPENGSLVTVGSLQGLGEGEKIYSVRFEGNLGYVVTYDQTDPLYVVDLSNPQNPLLAGQVSLSGYSSFLQPLGNGLLLGVGQAVDQDLRTQGLQVEVFDVADSGQPALVSDQQLGDNATSAAEYDPHALLWWPQSDLLVMPVDDYSGNGPSSAAYVWTVSSAGTLTRVGTLAQPVPSASPAASTPGGNSVSRSSGSGSDQPAVVYGYPEIERAVVVGNDIYTLSEQGVMANDMTSLALVAWLPYQNTAP
jgi:hypothetical protein